MCQEEIRATDISVTHGSCRNTWHRSCLDTWGASCNAQRRNTTCPLCRVVLLHFAAGEDEGDEHEDEDEADEADEEDEVDEEDEEDEEGHASEHNVQTKDQPTDFLCTLNLYDEHFDVLDSYDELVALHGSEPARTALVSMPMNESLLDELVPEDSWIPGAQEFLKSQTVDDGTDSWVVYDIWHENPGFFGRREGFCGCLYVIPAQRVG